MRLNQKDKKINSKTSKEILEQLLGEENESNQIPDTGVPDVPKSSTDGRKTPHNAIKVFWLWEIEIKVRLNTEDQPIKNLTFAVASPYQHDALKLAKWEAEKRGMIRGHTFPKVIDIAFAYYPNRVNKPNISAAHKQVIWDLYEDDEITAGECVWDLSE